MWGFKRVASSHHAGVTSATIGWGEGSVPHITDVPYTLVERADVRAQVYMGGNEWASSHVSWGGLWLEVTAALSPPCHPREAWEREAECCRSHPVWDSSEAKAADCPGEDQRNPETSSQEHQVERGLWVSQRRMGLWCPPPWFPWEAIRGPGRPAVGGANPFNIEPDVPFLRELLLCTAGKRTKSGVRFCERLFVASRWETGRRLWLLLTELPLSPSTAFRESCVSNS